MDITLQDIKAARDRIQGIAVQTPLKPAYSLTERTGRNIWLKMETMQPTGAFKLRGAANAIMQLSPEQKQAGVLTMSTGNHGKAIAYVAKKLGIRAVICISAQVPEVKIQGMKKLGVEVRVAGKDQDEADIEARSMAQSEGLFFISAFDSAGVIAGQGTVALEVLEQEPSIDTMIIPLSGGGLMAGMAIAAKNIKPGIRLVGVSMEQGAAMHLSIQAGQLVTVDEQPSLADALTGGIPADNQFSFPLCQQYVDRSFLVSEASIAKAMAYALRWERIVLEGGAATSIACLEEYLDEIPGQNIALICTGDNVAVPKLLDIYHQHYAEKDTRS
ncbi:MAG: pyridoxal-phosphate dependent enzyme [Saprospiraceae bacterium]|nr:pyridoxal-phosphate dependent enzyme [Saprospiraceae bacterium]